MRIHPSIDIDRLSIVIVDDARFTCEMIKRVLLGAGFIDIRIANNAAQALELIRERPANILIADWLMPEMDGLSLTKRVRQLDEDSHHYTYVILLTAKEGLESLTEAFNQGVDDFINKSPDNKELLARIHAAGRVSELQGDLIKANRKLLAMNRELEERHSFDAVTGLGNRAYLERQLDNLVRHIAGRGGAACCGVIRLNDIPALRAKYGTRIAEQVMEASVNRLQQAMRPLDVVARLDEQCFGILIRHEDDRRCHPNSFRRIHQALNLRAYKTYAGFLNITAAVAIMAVETEGDRLPAPAEIIDYLGLHLDAAEQAGRIYQVKWKAFSD
ncbi:hypothetical protein CAI21_03680 [Alkalilimnicola ehrlichii]|uniref:Response regulatory domain-containing protein n=1 Tax=Alkalilimnicola ehrlichii TaxID=351052 RepID=A0A3E0X1P6_9GAMM|nr:response regulator [Alkalilimnicola ehrlichii]RFA30630.1 hypothetical protein CAI21_03680 [Alkalilimnicola ehrlichii]RFA38211.1 hypothetical protein CAL65_05040 [Alkalilimnicola ehrlichii]